MQVKIDRRSGTDRRRRRLLSLKAAFAYRRRRELRRAEDRRRIVLLDQYSASILVLIALILVLSVADALLTLFLLDHGAVELNPVMAYFIQISPLVFMVAKYLITTLSLIIILTLNYAGIQRLSFHAHHLFKCFAGCFVAVIVWEIFLIVRFVS